MTKETQTETRLNLSLHFLTILVTIIGCAFYMGQTIATLSTKVENLKSQVDYIQIKVDSLSKVDRPVSFLSKHKGGSIPPIEFQ